MKTVRKKTPELVTTTQMLHNVTIKLLDNEIDYWETSRPMWLREQHTVVDRAVTRLKALRSEMLFVAMSPIK